MEVPAGQPVAIVGFLTMTTGALVAVQGYNQLASVGFEALTGFASAFFNVRLIVPGTVSVALSATIGAGATAQIGAMRINEEIEVEFTPFAEDELGDGFTLAETLRLGKFCE